MIEHNIIKWNNKSTIKVPLLGEVKMSNLKTAIYTVSITFTVGTDSFGDKPLVLFLSREPRTY